MIDPRLLTLTQAMTQPSWAPQVGPLEPINQPWGGGNPSFGTMPAAPVSSGISPVPVAPAPAPAPKLQGVIRGTAFAGGQGWTPNLPTQGGPALPWASGNPWDRSGGNGRRGGIGRFAKGGPVKAKLGSGERFHALESKLSHREGVHNPGALAAYIGRQKYGAKKMASLAAHGKPGYQAGGKVEKVMHEFKTGALNSSSGQPVTNRKQAIAIALSEARRQKAGHYQNGGDVTGQAGPDQVDAKLTADEYVIQKPAADAINAVFPQLLDLLNDPQVAGEVAGLLKQVLTGQGGPGEEGGEPTQGAPMPMPGGPGGDMGQMMAGGQG